MLAKAIEAHAEAHNFPTRRAATKKRKPHAACGLSKKIRIEPFRAQKKTASRGLRMAAECEKSQAARGVRLVDFC